MPEFLLASVIVVVVVVVYDIIYIIIYYYIIIILLYIILLYDATEGVAEGVAEHSFLGCTGWKQRSDLGAKFSKLYNKLE